MQIFTHIKTGMSMTAIALLLAGCSTDMHNSTPVVPMSGPSVALTETPYTPLLECVGKYVKNKPKYTIAVDTIPDLTGVFSPYAGGYQVTQGAQDMAVSALAETGAYNLVERSHMNIPLFELRSANDFLLRDDNPADNFTDSKGRLARKIASGELMGSDYILMGSITELNLNLSSGGYDLSIYGIGGGWRSFWYDVALDLRLVDTKTSLIKMAIPARKQLWGYENKAGVLNFFGTTFVDANAGQKVQEPAGIAVRSVIEDSVFQMTKQLYHLPANVCQAQQQKADSYMLGDYPKLEAYHENTAK